MQSLKLNYLFLLLIGASVYGCSNFEKDIVCFIRLGDCNCVYHPDRVECQVDTVKKDKKDPPIYAGCICKLPDNDVQAFFDDKPSMYGEFPEKPISVYASRCVNINLCPEPITVVRGSLYIDPYSWTFKDDLVGERDYSILEGTPTDKDGNPVTVKKLIREKEKIKVNVASIEGGVTIGASKLQCEEECKSDSLYCSKIPVEGIGMSRGNSLKRLQERISNTDVKEIKIDDLVNMFNLQGDPCGRSDIEIVGKEVVNSGNECEITQQADLGVSGNVVLKLSIPVELHAKVSNSGSYLDLTFPNPEKSAALKITDSEGTESWLNTDYGGLINRIQSTPDKAIFSTESGCISVAFE